MLTHNSTENLNKSDIPSLLSEAIQNGIIDLTDVQKKIDMTKREQYLNLHKESYNVWQGTNGNWYTYLPDSTKKQNRRLVKKSTLTKVEDEIIAYYKALEEKHQSKNITLNSTRHGLITRPCKPVPACIYGVFTAIGRIIIKMIH